MLTKEKLTVTLETVDTVEPGETVEAARQALPAHRLRYEALLALHTMIWATPFLVVKYAVKLSGPFTSLAIGSAVGSLTLAVIFRKRLAPIMRAELRGGLILGLRPFACRVR